MKKNNRGITIIEIIIALAILSMVLLAVLNTFRFSFTLLSSTERDNLVIYFAAEKLEEAKIKTRKGINPALGETAIVFQEGFEGKYQIKNESLEPGLQELKIIVDYGQKRVVLLTKVGNCSEE